MVNEYIFVIYRNKYIGIMLHYNLGILEETVGGEMRIYLRACDTGYIHNAKS